MNQNSNYDKNNRNHNENDTSLFIDAEDEDEDGLNEEELFFIKKEQNYEKGNASKSTIDDVPNSGGKLFDQNKKDRLYEYVTGDSRD